MGSHGFDAATSTWRRPYTGGADVTDDVLLSCKEATTPSRSMRPVVQGDDNRHRFALLACKETPTVTVLLSLRRRETPTVTVLLSLLHRTLQIFDGGRPLSDRGAKNLTAGVSCWCRSTGSVTDAHGMTAPGRSAARGGAPLPLRPASLFLLSKRVLRTTHRCKGRSSVGTRRNP